MSLKIWVCGDCTIYAVMPFYIAVRPEECVVSVCEQQIVVVFILFFIRAIQVLELFKLPKLFAVFPFWGFSVYIWSR